MSEFKSDFLNVLSERGFIHQISDPKGLDELCAKETVTATLVSIAPHRAFMPGLSSRS